MKQLTWKLVLPLTVISMIVVTKWWHVQPEDAWDILMGGFPLIFYGDGFHTSLSFQFFAFEFFIDLLVYFLCWFFIVFALKRYAMKLLSKPVLAILWTLTAVLFSLIVFVVSVSSPVFEVKRDWNGKVLATGCKVIWKGRPPMDLPAEK